MVALELQIKVMQVALVEIRVAVTQPAAAAAVLVQLGQMLMQLI
jgi:hypothetical protein